MGCCEREGNYGTEIDNHNHPGRFDGGEELTPHEGS